MKRPFRLRLAAGLFALSVSCSTFAFADDPKPPEPAKDAPRRSAS